MSILVCRTAWMSTYADLKEPAKSQHGWILAGNQAFEALNFLPHDKWYYGFVQHNDTTKKVAEGAAAISIEKLGGGSGDKVEGVTVVFCAPEPTTKKLLITGWYKDATVYRHYIKRPDTDEINYIRFKAKRAVLIPDLSRAFEIPRARDGNEIGGVGQRDIWYGLNEPKAKDFSQRLFEYLDSKNEQNPVHNTIIEEKRARMAKRYERIGSVRGFIHEKGFCCEACGWKIKKEDQKIWGSSFELHHIQPVASLEVGMKRQLTSDDFTVLCATCHRAIHRTENADDVSAFKKTHSKPR